MKTGRNDPCPCGSGRKFKRCCLLVVSPVVAPADAPAQAAEEAAPIPAPVKPGGGRDWVPLQHQLGERSPNRFGRKKPY